MTGILYSSGRAGDGRGGEREGEKRQEEGVGSLKRGLDIASNF